ncbi:MAG TPA: hypothetical protein VKX34_01330 [Aequorivita sp.]|nr:hypothetical protein [Aequorivita sp.]
MKNVLNTETKLSFNKIILLGLVALIGASCSQDDLAPTPEAVFVAPTAAEFENLREIALAMHTETALFNAEEGITFTSNDNAELTIYPNCLSLNGDPVTGEVELTFVDIYDSKFMAPTNKPTMGLKSNGDKAMLITGGEFFIEVRKDGVLLDADCSYKLVVPGDNTGGADPEMILWNGLIDDNGDLTWDPMRQGDGGHGEGHIFIEESSYFVFTHNFGWTNIDKFYNDPREKTTLKVKVPEEFNFANCAMYLTYDGEGHALAKLDRFDPETSTFSEHYGQIPIGMNVHLLFVTADGDDYRYAIQGVTITENEIYEFTLDETEIGTYDDWVTAIEALP